MNMSKQEIGRNLTSEYESPSRPPRANQVVPLSNGEGDDLKKADANSDSCNGDNIRDSKLQTRDADTSVDRLDNKNDKWKNIINSNNNNDNNNNKSTINNVKEDSSFQYWKAYIVDSIAASLPVSKMVDFQDLQAHGLRNPIAFGYQFVYFFFLAFFFWTQFTTGFNNLFLAPTGSNEKSICSPVPITINDLYYADQNGHWSTDSKFDFKTSIFNIIFLNVNIDNENWSRAMNHFDDEFSKLSKKAALRDFSWNYIMWASYYTEFSDWKQSSSDQSEPYAGSLQFMLNSDSSIMFNLKPYKAGFASKLGFCDTVLGDKANRGTLHQYTLDDDDSCSDSFSMAFYYGTSTADDRRPFKIGIDTRSLTTALAVNLGLIKLSKLSEIYMKDAIDISLYSHLVSSHGWFIDSYYAPMDPILCFTSVENVQFCFVISLPPENIQDGTHSLYYPITSSHGTKGECWTRERITCPDNDESIDVLDIMIGYIFFPSKNIIEYIQFGKKMSDFFVTDPENGDYFLTETIFPALQNSVLSAYSDSELQAEEIGGNCDFANRNVDDDLEDAFQSLCEGKCAMLFSELYGNGMFNPVSKDYYVIRNGSCSNTVYFPEAMEGLRLQTPTVLVQSYDICHLSREEATLQALGISFANAAVISSLFLSLITYLAIYYVNTVKLETGRGLRTPAQIFNVLKDAVAMLLEKNENLNQSADAVELIAKLKSRKKTIIFPSIKKKNNEIPKNVDV